jgi:HPt (histidine-containing phosphotransfer) domain-containing protein
MLRSMQRPGRPSLIARLIQLYLTSSPAHLRSLRDAVANDDAPGLAFAAHSFKSESANLGATSLAAVLQQLELLGKSGQTAGADELVAQIGDLHARVCDVLAAQPEAPDRISPAHDVA